MKKTLLLYLSFLIAPYLHAQIITDGLIAYYPFNGDITDASGNGLDAESPTDLIFAEDRFGNTNAALSYSIPDQHLIVKYDPIFDFGADDEFTISVWLYYPFFDGFYGNLIYKGPNLGVWNFDIDYGILLSDAPYFMLYPGKRAANWGINEFIGNHWNHIVYTYSKGTLKSYLNAEPDNFYETSVFKAQNDLIIGQMNNNTINNWHNIRGKFDDIAIYNRALSPSEVELLYSEIITSNTTLADTDIRMAFHKENRSFTIISKNQIIQTDVYDMYGRKIRSTTNLTIDNLAQGSYILYVQSTDGIKKELVVVP